jgi:deoxyribodipyrimidine photo-lyase
MNNGRFDQIIQSNKSGLVTYIMSDSFRIHYNHGLAAAYDLSISTSQQLQIILIRTPEENERNNVFFQQGITGYQRFLSKFTNDVYYFEKLTDFFFKLLDKSSTVIKDRAYLSEHRIIEDQIEEYLSQKNITFTIVESNVLVPVKVASIKEEYGARTIRPRIMNKIQDFIDIIDFKSPRFFFEQKANDLLHNFIQFKLKNYDRRNDPSLSVSSELSAYLKYGFISPLEIYEQVHNSGIKNADLFIEELIVRRELAYNFVYYNRKYNDFHHMTYGWAYKTMEYHVFDTKEYLYTLNDYITFKTHDEYFNTAMKEMVHLGTMHGYMRMYWAKKIIEWSPSFEVAYKNLIYLNNYYFLDGNNPNGYAGIAWTFGKHDRAWAERPIFGKIRYMNQAGLKRKFDMDNYVIKIDKLVQFRQN